MKEREQFWRGDIKMEDYDWECTCDTMEWEPTEDGFKGCPFCETYDGEWEEED